VTPAAGPEVTRGTKEHPVSWAGVVLRRTSPTFGGRCISGDEGNRLVSGRAPVLTQVGGPWGLLIQVLPLVAPAFSPWTLKKYTPAKECRPPEGNLGFYRGGELPAPRSLDVVCEPPSQALKHKTTEESSPSR